MKMMMMTTLAVEELEGDFDNTENTVHEIEETLDNELNDFDDINDNVNNGIKTTECEQDEPEMKKGFIHPE